MAGLDGVLGTLLDLARIEPGWEPAVEAALGEALASVVVDDAEHAASAVRTLARDDTRGAVIALGTAAPPAAPTVSPVAGAEVIRPHVTSDRDDVSRLLDVLLSGAVRVAGIDEAIAIATVNPTAVVATADGHRLAATGWRIGAAASGGATAAALDDATARHRDAERALDACRLEIDRCTDRVVSAERHETELSARLDENDRRFTAATEALARSQAELREIHAEVEPLQQRIAELAEQVAGEAARIAELDALVPDLEAGASAEEAAARARSEVRAMIDTRAALLVGRRRDLELRAAGRHERRELLTGRLAEADRRLAADAAERATAEHRRTQVERSLRALERLAEFVSERRTAVASYRDRLDARRRAQSAAIAAVAARLDDRRGRRSAAERELDEVRERARRCELDETEARLRLESAVEMLRHDLDVEPDAAEAVPAPELPDGVSATARVRELEREVRLLGPINPLALEEFGELQQRHTFLEEQLDDVRSTRRELSRVIRAVDQEIESVFAAAYADVSAHFASLFGGLFPGGTGRLVLTTPDDLLNTGIEVEAKPGGKNVKKLSLLSGGERSLTALAFLFAVFRSRPSPFYVMDEVEAALDDVNLHRFLGLIAEFRAEAQLLIVSHQKRTMEAGDCLFGVTMQPGGSSKVIAERISLSA